MSMLSKKKPVGNDVLDCTKILYAHNNPDDYDIIVKHQAMVGFQCKGRTMTKDDVEDFSKFYINYYDPSYKDAYEISLREYGNKLMTLDFNDTHWETLFYIDKPLHTFKDKDFVQVYGKHSDGRTYVSTMQFWMFKDVWHSDDYPEHFI